MYHHNFLFRQYPDSCYPAGRPYTFEVPRPGKYRVTVTLKTAIPLERVSIYAGPESLAFMGNIPAGVFRQTAVVNVGNGIHEGQECVSQDRTITVIIMAESDCLSGLSVSEISCPTIYIAGSADSVSAGYAGRIGQSKTFSLSHMPGSSDIKWERMLTAYTDHKIAVSDYSRSGLTTETFRKEGYYAAINEYSKPGDFYFFHFDPLGQSMENWVSGGICRRHLARYIIECRERLVYPVLVTPSVIRDEDDYSGQLWEQCFDAYREVGKLTATPVIELHKLRVTSYDAYVAAGLVAQEIARICKAYSVHGYRFLAKCMRANPTAVSLHTFSTL